MLILVSVMTVSTQDLPATAFALFPNPVKDRLTIRLAMTGAYDVSVFPADGQLLLRRQGLQGQSTIFMEQWSAGVYVIELTNEQGALQRLVSKQ